MVLIRMVIEEGLNQLPYQDCDVITPTGCSYSGLKYEKGNCGVSIVRYRAIPHYYHYLQGVLK